MRKAIIYLAVFVLLLAAPTGLRYLRFYSQGETEEPQEPPQYTVAAVPPVPTPDMAAFTDEPEVGQGLVLLDQAHDNNFTLDEIEFLDGRLAARGYELVPYTSGDLASALRSMTAFIVIIPQVSFDLEEVLAVSNFVDRGGRLLLIGDPTRFTVTIEEDLLEFTFRLHTDKIPLNSLANEFDIIFNDDYLYNTSENEGNFRNIILKEDSLVDDPFTEDLEQLVFYGSHSLHVGPQGNAILVGDDNTWSSDTDRPGDVTLAAAARNGRVLALGDIHLLIEPYYTVFDNSQFIARIADFLTQSEREFVLSDFPYFYGPEINLIYIGSPDLGPDAFDEIITIQDTFSTIARTLSLSNEPQADQDTLYLGLYNQSEDVADILAERGIELIIDPPVLTEAEQADLDKDSDSAEPEEPVEVTQLIQSNLGKVQMSGTSLILLHEEEGQRQVIVLAASASGLESSINRLIDMIPLDADYALADCLRQDTLALCPTNIAAETVEATLETGGAPDDGDTAPEEEEAETPEEEEEEEGSEEGEVSPPEGVDQGTIGLDDSVEAVLEEDEAHLWTFNSGPATIDITVESSEELDAVLELYGPDNALIDAADSGFTGDNEEILGIEIPDDGDYTILVKDFYGNSNEYTLVVASADDVGDSNGSDSAERIFVFGDDDGEPLTDGFTSVETITALLEDEYDITTWVSSIDGPLSGDALAEHFLVVWDSGDYRDEEGFLGEDTFILFDYLDTGGNLIVIGASPTFFGDTDLAPLSDLEVAGDDPILLDGLTAGDVIELDQTYEAIFSDVFTLEENEEGEIFFLRGPASEQSGGIIGIAATGEELDLGDQKIAFFFAPLTSLPDDVQATVLNNLVQWVAADSS